MEAFQYYTPTKVIFGKDTHKQVGQVIRSYGFHKVLFTTVPARSSAPASTTRLSPL